jgi:hypothetical protein
VAIPSQREYEEREWREFQRQLKDAEGGSLSERREACQSFFEVMRDDPDLVGQRIGWLLDGNYGYGSYKAAHQTLTHVRMNRAAWLTNTIGALEWMCPQRMITQAWKRLTPEQKSRLQRAVDREISSALAEGSNGRDPARRSRRRMLGRRTRRDDLPPVPRTREEARKHAQNIMAVMRQYPGPLGRSSNPHRQKARNRARARARALGRGS